MYILVSGVYRDGLTRETRNKRCYLRLLYSMKKVVFAYCAIAAFMGKSDCDMFQKLHSILLFFKIVASILF